MTLEEMNASIIIDGGTESLLERLEVNKVIAAQDEDINSEELFPITKELIYNYDFGDNWIIKITKYKNRLKVFLILKEEVNRSMNYNEFMKSVDEKLATMSEKEKTKWIYNIARAANEHDRSKFLNSLDGKKEYRPAIYDKDELEEWCKKIEDGEIYFECNGYEEYGQDYWDNDFVYFKI